MSQPPAGDGAAINQPERADPDHASTRRLARCGPVLGGGVLVLGIFSALAQVLGRVAQGPITSATWVQSALEGVSTLLAYAVGGAILAILCQLGASLIDRLERHAREAAALIDQARRAVTALERLAEGLERPTETKAAPVSRDLDRARLMGEVEEAARSARWADAESLLDQLDGQSPGDTAVSGLRQRIDSARRTEIEGRMAQLHAARQVNDPDRVLELYRSIATALEPERKSELESDLARWFLSLIHRRLRLGKIQPDVVRLATQAAEVFAATVEGASMRAALPTLRRSVDLCPRCAQPYRGNATACPKCLAASSGMMGQATPDVPDDSDSA